MIFLSRSLSLSLLILPISTMFRYRILSCFSQSTFRFIEKRLILSFPLAFPFIRSRPQCESEKDFPCKDFLSAFLGLCFAFCVIFYIVISRRLCSSFSVIPECELNQARNMKNVFCTSFEGSFSLAQSPSFLSIECLAAIHPNAYLWLNCRCVLASHNQSFPLSSVFCNNKVCFCLGRILNELC